MLKSALPARLRMLVGTSETIRLLLIILPFVSPLCSDCSFLYFLGTFHLAAQPHFSQSKEKLRFNEWLGGLIDGDGCFLLSKAGYGSLEIVGHVRDKHSLYQVKQAFGGSLQHRANANHLRYRLHHRAGLLALIHAVGPHIRNPTRLVQLNNICVFYGYPSFSAQPLPYRSG
jgi:hypothetical protein